MARLKLATYNINGIRARLGALLEWLERERPDIVCLQELKAPDEAFPVGDIEALGYGALWHGQKSWNGVAILARGAKPEERCRGLPGGDGDDQSRYLEASVHGLVVGCLYLPNGNPWPGPKFDYKLDWFGRLIRHSRALLRDGGPVVLAGDFNVVPTDELDIYDPKSWRKDALLQPESREAWFRLVEQGWTDSLRSVAGDSKVFTFWDYFRKHWERDAGLRIDHLLLSPALSGMLADAGVDRWVRGRPGASDHAPTWVLLEAGDNAKATRRTALAARIGATRSESGPSQRVAKRGGESGSDGAEDGRNGAHASAGTGRARNTAASSTRSGAAVGQPVAPKRGAKTGVAGKKVTKRSAGAKVDAPATPEGKGPVKKRAATKTAVKKRAVGKSVPEKTPAWKAMAKKTAAKKTTAKKVAAKETAAKKTPAKKTAR